MNRSIYDMSKEAVCTHISSLEHFKLTFVGGLEGGAVGLREGGEVGFAVGT